MPRRKYYPDGRKQLNVIVPTQVKDRLDVLAQEQGQSTSQVVTRILSDWLRGRGELPDAEKVPA